MAYNDNLYAYNNNYTHYSNCINLKKIPKSCRCNIGSIGII